MPIQVLSCPACGAPLPPEALRGVWVCAYCKNTLICVNGAAIRFDPDDDSDEPQEFARRPRVTVAGRAYRVLGRLAQGDGADVFLARRAARLTELVVLKVIRAREDADLLAREWKVLQTLHGSGAQGSHYFTALLPQLVIHGELVDVAGHKRPASVFRWRSGFQLTLEDVAALQPQGVDARSAVWMWKRALELLGWVHRSGYMHGAVLPQHLLIHPRDHGVVLVGWSSAVRPAMGEPLPAMSAANHAYYPSEVWSGAPPSPSTDITMSARCLIRVLGGDPARGTIPDRVPAPLAALLRAHADNSSREADAWALMERVSRAGREAFGPPKYHPLDLPGWR